MKARLVLLCDADRCGLLARDDEHAVLREGADRIAWNAGKIDDDEQGFFQLVHVDGRRALSYEAATRSIELVEDAPNFCRQTRRDREHTFCTYLTVSCRAW